MVKGIRFQGLRDAGDPAERAALYERQGADEIVILDVSATPEGRGNQVETVRRVRARLGIPLTVGGGIRTLDDAGPCSRPAPTRSRSTPPRSNGPALLSEIAERFGRQCTRAGDRRRAPATAASRCWSRAGARAPASMRSRWAREGIGRGAGEILLTSWDRDGTRAGYDLELTRAVAAAVRVPVIASGGAAGRGASEGGVRCRRRRGARGLDLPRRRD